jgi:hypothetical protein
LYSPFSSGDARFAAATFAEAAWFVGATFSGRARFGGAWVRVAEGARRFWPAGWALSETAGVPWPGAEGEWRQLVEVSVAPAVPDSGVPATE